MAGMTIATNEFRPHTFMLESPGGGRRGGAEEKPGAEEGGGGGAEEKPGAEEGGGAEEKPSSKGY